MEAQHNPQTTLPSQGDSRTTMALARMGIADLVNTAIERLDANERSRITLDLGDPQARLWVEAERFVTCLTEVLRTPLHLQSGPILLTTPAQGEERHLTLVWSSDENQEAAWKSTDANEAALQDLKAMGFALSQPVLPEPQHGLVVRLSKALSKTLTQGGGTVAA